jgi:4-hydroxy-3-methylbut-2-en-1-yl diphosphate reductase
MVLLYMGYVIAWYNPYGDCMKIEVVRPNGYCHGVASAILRIVELSKSDTPKPIHVYGMVIHNTHVTQALSRAGVISHMQPKLSDIDQMQGTIVFTAHGTPKATKEYAASKGLTCVDVTCKDVTSTLTLIDDFIAKGYNVLYIGKHGHPESIAASEDPRVTLVERLEEIQALDLQGKWAVTNQTTLSILELAEQYHYLRETYPEITIMNEICNATLRRQEAVLDHFDKDLLIVVGDQKSNNSQNLAKMHPNGVLIQSYRDLENLDLNVDTVAVTAGASTPRQILNEVIEALEHYHQTGSFAYTSTMNDERILALK